MDTEIPFLIAPFCIYHYIDTKTNTYHGYIGYSTKIKTKDGNTILKCPTNDTKYGPWGYHGQFYAFSPLLRPIPSGLKLFTALKSNKFPYNTESVTYAYDPFNIQDNAVNFLTWNKPVADTVKLYLHITPSGDSFPSFLPNPPTEDTYGWSHAIMSPIFVLVDKNEHNFPHNQELVGNYPKKDNDIPDFKFKNIDQRCIPNQYGESIEKCFLSSDENIYDNKKYARTILGQLKYKQGNSPKFWYVIIVGSIFFIIIIAISKLRNEF